MKLTKDTYEQRLKSWKQRKRNYRGENRMLPNIFLNPYQQPENKLTYNFLCLLKHYNEQDFLDFLFDHKFQESKITDFESVFGGEEACPDGMIQLETNRKTVDIYLEVKTFRRNVDLEQIKRHIEYKCNHENSYLLVIASKINSEKEIKGICSDKIFVKTWTSIASFLEKDRSNWIVDEFLSYGDRKGEFRHMSISKGDICSFNEHYTRIKNLINDASCVLEQAIELIRKTILDPRKYELKVMPRRSLGAPLLIQITWEKINGYDFGQWMSCGLYLDEEYYDIKFKEKDMPELAFFMDMDNKKVLNIPAELKNKFKEIEGQGFEDNSDGEITNNRWRVLFKRIPLSQIEGGLNDDAVADFFKQCIDVFKNDVELNKLL